MTSLSLRLRSVERTIQRVEEEANPTPLSFIIRGGMPGGPHFATAPGHRWERGADESTSDFEERVLAASRALGLPVIIGGLPPRAFEQRKVT